MSPNPSVHGAVAGTPVAVVDPIPADGNTFGGPDGQNPRDRETLQDAASQTLARRTAHGALSSTLSQGASFTLRVGSMMVLARMLLKEDFGLVNMVTAVTGFLGLFRDAGLSMATVQRESVTNAQASTLFWVNVALGVALATVLTLMSPLFAAFYSEPRLISITIALGVSFVFNGATTQHRAILQRQMRLTLLAAVDVAALFLSIVVAVALAAAGAGYWSLVAMAVAQPALTMPGVWIASRWIPGRPRRGTGIGSMLHYGGTVTLNNVVMYLAYNVDKVLLGRFFGAEALGVYGRAYQLINIPAENLNSAMGAVAFPALSRLQNSPDRLKSYFLTGYSLLLSVALPVTVACGLFSADIIRVFLGPQWDESARVFRLLAPTVIALSMINPFGWLMYASGYARRSLLIALAIAPVVILGSVTGLTRGPLGVAFGYSAAMLMLIVPVIAWAKSGTPISTGDIVRSVWRLALATAVAAAVVFVLGGWIAVIAKPFTRLVAESAVFFSVYGLMLLVVLKQAPLFVRVFREAGMWPSGKPREATI